MNKTEAILSSFGLDEFLCPFKFLLFFQGVRKFGLPIILVFFVLLVFFVGGLPKTLHSHSEVCEAAAEKLRKTIR